MHGFQGLMLQYFLYFTSFTLLAAAKVVQSKRNTKYLFNFLQATPQNQATRRIKSEEKNQIYTKERPALPILCFSLKVAQARHISTLTLLRQANRAEGLLVTFNIIL